LWLRAGRAQRKLTLDDVARVTKIQPRILEKLETGQLEGLPAEVFVRGFVKSFARCVGLDEGEAVERYGACAGVAMTPATTAARAFVETLVAAPAREPSATRAAAGTPSVALPVVAQLDDVPVVDEIPVVVADAPTAPATATAIEVIEAAPAATEEIPAPAKKKRASRKKASTTGAPTTRSRKKKPTVAPESELLAAGSLELAAQSTELAAPSAELAAGSLELAASTSTTELAISTDHTTSEPELAMTFALHAIEVIDQSAPLPLDEVQLAQGSEPVSSTDASVDLRVWQPTMPPIAATPTVPWKRPSTSVTSTTYTAPTLVIDDADPDLADLEREEREAAAKAGPHRVSFLPPILLDRDDKSGRQGGLTLAVIILLIAATLTLSYLMRRPSVSGDGVTMTEPVATSTIPA